MDSRSGLNSLCSFSASKRFGSTNWGSKSSWKLCPHSLFSAEKRVLGCPEKSVKAHGLSQEKKSRNCFHATILSKFGMALVIIQRGRERGEERKGERTFFLQFIALHLFYVIIYVFTSCLTRFLSTCANFVAELSQQFFLICHIIHLQ